jgi:hypothetical protein
MSAVVDQKHEDSLGTYAQIGKLRTKYSLVDLIDTDPDTLLISDIIYSAQRIIRFTGHSDVTLAQHLARVYQIVKARLQAGGAGDSGIPLSMYEDLFRGALLHDAHEILIADIANPVKKALRIHEDNESSSYDRMESGIMRAYAERFRFTYPHHAIIKEADLLALRIEATLTWGSNELISWDLPHVPLTTMARFSSITNEDFETALAEEGLY